MRYCALCGIPITARSHASWLKEFRAVWIENDHWGDVRLSGVGVCDESDDVVTGTVPTDPHKHSNDSLDPDSMIDVALCTISVKSVVYPETIRYWSEPFWGVGFHSSCWNLFQTGFTPNLRLLFAACLSMPIGENNIMDWGHNYGGAAAMLKNLEIPILGSRFSDLTSAPKDMLSDPFEVPSLTKAVQHSSRLQNDAFQSRLSPDILNFKGDKFCRLSPELLHLIVTLLPTHDVRSLRLASPVFAMLSLSEKFWASRFQEGNEFDNIFEVLHHPPESWRALYLSLQVWASDNPHMANRRRVWGLVKHLQKILRQMEGVPCDGSPLETWYEPSLVVEPRESGGKTSWLTAARSINNPKKGFESGCRALRARALHLLQPLEVREMSVSFVHTGGGLFVSGLLFVDKDGQSHALGYLHPSQTAIVRISTAHRIQGWELAFDMSGIRAIAIITEDGTRSPWAGEPGNFPRWHLAAPEGISAVKAEFDALKLVSLSRNSSREPSANNQWRNSCLWYPNVPPERMLFNGSDGDQPPDEFELPITTLFFNQSDGGDMSSLVEIVVWTLDICHIAGIEFKYTDISQNRHLGHTGPFGDDHPAAKSFDIPDGRRISIPIDGLKGEELQSIEVQENGGSLVGLKIHTNFGQEATSPQCPFTTDEEWIVVQPTGSKVVGSCALGFGLDIDELGRR
ncbi:hypothetical protein AK830_g11959 [Neonectria ditissima]|uniref:DUF7600 domain-containing protein n=1 Tax=Neonectria ditissima TaxID=78410 RepID=A0A0P7B478_9HYPO|nr:hypothetical protein AK830_g11959 [Neonectria ditissima]